MTVEAVIWDFGGVFTTSPFEAFNRYEVKHQLPADLIRRVNATNPDANAWALFESARIGMVSTGPDRNQTMVLPEFSAALDSIHG